MGSPISFPDEALRLSLGYTQGRSPSFVNCPFAAYYVMPLSLSKYMHLRLLLDFNMRLCVTLVSPGVPFQSRMKIYSNTIIVYTPVNISTVQSRFQ